MNTLKTVLTVILVTCAVTTASANCAGTLRGCPDVYLVVPKERGLNLDIYRNQANQTPASDARRNAQTYQQGQLQMREMIQRQRENEIRLQQLAKEQEREELIRQAYQASTDSNGNLDEQALYKNLVKAGQADIIPALRKEFDARRDAAEGESALAEVMTKLRDKIEANRKAEEALVRRDLPPGFMTELWDKSATRQEVDEELARQYQLAKPRLETLPREEWSREDWILDAWGREAGQRNTEAKTVGDTQ